MAATRSNSARATRPQFSAPTSTRHAGDQAEGLHGLYTSCIGYVRHCSAIDRICQESVQSLYDPWRGGAGIPADRRAQPAHRRVAGAAARVGAPLRRCCARSGRTAASGSTRTTTCGVWRPCASTWPGVGCSAALSAAGVRAGEPGARQRCAEPRSRRTSAPRSSARSTRSTTRARRPRSTTCWRATASTSMLRDVILPYLRDLGERWSRGARRPSPRSTSRRRCCAAGCSAWRAAGTGERAARRARLRAGRAARPLADRLRARAAPAWLAHHLSGRGHPAADGRRNRGGARPGHRRAGRHR